MRNKSRTPPALSASLPNGPNLETIVASLAALAADESGQDLIEYALVAALLGLAAVTTMRGLSTKIGNAFNSIGTSLTANV